MGNIFDEFIKSDWDKCPKCGKIGELNFRPLESDGLNTWREINCKCGFEFKLCFAPMCIGVGNEFTYKSNLEERLASVTEELIGELQGFTVQSQEVEEAVLTKIESLGITLNECLELVEIDNTFGEVRGDREDRKSYRTIKDIVLENIYEQILECVCKVLELGIA